MELHAVALKNAMLSVCLYQVANKRRSSTGFSYRLKRIEYHGVRAPGRERHASTDDRERHSVRV